MLLHPAALIANRALTAQITHLANEAFMRSKAPDWKKWDNSRVRFPTVETYWDMLDEEAIVALVFDRDASPDTVGREVNGNGSDGESNGKVVACAAAVPWKGGWKKEGAGREDGWEIKAVCVDGDSKYLRKGLAVQVMQALEDELVARAKAQQRRMTNGSSYAAEPGRGCVALWVLAAECINGAYWRKRGYREFRRSTEGKGTWGCKTSFELVVFRKDVEYEI
jgi:GNAT superfamily N-acetyltransferase